jgi:hypothetical protein
MSDATRNHPADLLSAYLDGELSPAERRAVEGHLEGCPECTALLEDLRRLDVAVAEERVPPVPAGLAERISRRLESGGGTVVPIPNRPRRAPRVPLTLAATLAAAAMLYLFWPDRPAVVTQVVSEGSRKDADFGTRQGTQAKGDGTPAVAGESIASDGISTGTPVPAAPSSPGGVVETGRQPGKTKAEPDGKAMQAAPPPVARNDSVKGEQLAHRKEVKQPAPGATNQRSYRDLLTLAPGPVTPSSSDSSTATQTVPATARPVEGVTGGVVGGVVGSPESATAPGSAPGSAVAASAPPPRPTGSPTSIPTARGFSADAIAPSDRTLLLDAGTYSILLTENGALTLNSTGYRCSVEPRELAEKPRAEGPEITSGKSMDDAKPSPEIGDLFRQAAGADQPAPHLTERLDPARASSSTAANQVPLRVAPDSELAKALRNLVLDRYGVLLRKKCGPLPESLTGPE